MHWRRKWQPTPVFLPGKSQGRGSLVGCRLWGCQSRTRLKRLSNSSSSRVCRRSVHIFKKIHIKRISLISCLILKKIYRGWRDLWRDDLDIRKNLPMSFFICFWKTLMESDTDVWICRCLVYVSEDLIKRLMSWRA